MCRPRNNLIRTFNHQYEFHVAKCSNMPKLEWRKMIAFFRFDTNEEKHALLDRARNVALTAIQKYEIA